MYFKKSIAVLSAIVLMIASMITAGAEDGGVFAVESTVESGNGIACTDHTVFRPGEEISVKFKATQNTGISFVKLFIDYDETALEVKNCKAFGLLCNDDNISEKQQENGNKYLTFYSDGTGNDNPVSTSTGVFAEIVFKAKKVCADNLSITAQRFNDDDGFCFVLKKGNKSTLTPVAVDFKSQANKFSVHNMNGGIVTAPTCTKQGYTTYKCESCKAEITGDFKAASGHKFGEAVTVEPSYIDGGYSKRVCEICGYSEKFDFTAPLPDANGDGKIDLDDAILAAEIAVGGSQSSEELIKKADVNGDGKVTIHDALLIARLVSGVIDKLPVLKAQ